MIAGVVVGAGIAVGAGVAVAVGAGVAVGVGFGVAVGEVPPPWPGAGVEAVRLFVIRPSIAAVIAPPLNVF
ncbi:hypothetical protein D3C86_1884670 [compost metagenome]